MSTGHSAVAEMPRRQMQELNGAVVACGWNIVMYGRSFFGESFFQWEWKMADNVKDKIKEVGNAVSSAAKTAGENAKAIAGKVAEKAAEATKAVGDTLKKTGESIQKKSGK